MPDHVFLPHFNVMRKLYQSKIIGVLTSRDLKNETIIIEGKKVQDTRMLSPILSLTTSLAVNSVFGNSSLCSYLSNFFFLKPVSGNTSVKGRNHELSFKLNIFLTVLGSDRSI